MAELPEDAVGQPVPPPRQWNSRPTPEQVANLRARAAEATARRAESAGRRRPRSAGLRPASASAAGLGARQAAAPTPSSSFGSSKDAEAPRARAGPAAQGLPPQQRSPSGATRRGPAAASPSRSGPKGARPGAATAKPRPASAPSATGAQRRSREPPRGGVETAPRGGRCPAVQEQRERADMRATSSAKFLQEILEEERCKPRPWFDKHHLTFGGTRNELHRSEHREYFGAPRAVSMEHFADEVLRLHEAETPDPLDPPEERGHLGGLGRRTAAVPAGAATAAAGAAPGGRPRSASGAGGFSWRVPEEQDIARAVQQAEQHALALTERSSGMARSSSCGASLSGLEPRPTEASSGAWSAEKLSSRGSQVWDDRFWVGVAKDNERLHACQRAYFDAPSPRWAREQRSGQRWRGLRRPGRAASCAAAAAPQKTAAGCAASGRLHAPIGPPR